MASRNTLKPPCPQRVVSPPRCRVTGRAGRLAAPTGSLCRMRLVHTRAERNHPGRNETTRPAERWCQTRSVPASEHQQRGRAPMGLLLPPLCPEGGFWPGTAATPDRCLPTWGDQPEPKPNFPTPKPAPGLWQSREHHHKPLSASWPKLGHLLAVGSAGPYYNSVSGGQYPSSQAFSLWLSVGQSPHGPFALREARALAPHERGFGREFQPFPHPGLSCFCGLILQ